MNFHELYYQDPYLTEFEGSVLTCQKADGGYLISLDRTLFYPEGGGQPSDRGTLTAADGTVLTVLNVLDSPSGVLHLLEQPLEPGTPVHGRIDWDFRFPLMQNHTGEHIISGLAHRACGYENVGFHMGDVITLDLSGPLTREQALDLEREANEIIYRNLPVEVLYPTGEALEHAVYRSKKELEGDVRIVHIPETDDCACCGLHVRRTGEIGAIKLLSLASHRGGVRITMISGRPALADYEMKADAVTSIGQLLSVKPEETADAVRRLLDDALEKDRRIAEINARYFRQKAESFASGIPLILCFEEQMNQVELRKFCDLLVKTGKAGISAVLSETAPDTWQYCIGSTTTDLRAAAKTLNEKLNGRGGGKPVMIQGTFHANPGQIEAALRELA